MTTINAQTYPSICDNGGFEDGFTHYDGYKSVYNRGSSTCTPLTSSNTSIVYTSVTIPSIREFEIMGVGTDPVTGIDQVKFGTKSIKINSIYNHDFSEDSCIGDHGINKLTKQFEVTNENRDFTVWYAVSLENPDNHANTQPFFNINCDLAPLSSLCFDAEILECDTLLTATGCNSEVMDILDWTCHSIKIPKPEVGNIATLEIVMADCGKGGHNGYVYIDGICEGCTGSALGSLNLSDSTITNGFGIDYESCHGDKATICGNYTSPTLCGEWELDSIFSVGGDIENLIIDTINKTYCFEIDSSIFNGLDSIEFYIGGIFKKNGGSFLPSVSSNTIKIIKSEFYIRYAYFLGSTDCYDNSTPNISDDYFYLNLTLSNIGSDSWMIDRQLDYPYPNESGLTTIISGSGNAILELGPFLIQEGAFDLLINLGDCTYIEHISPPDYCSGCEAFEGVRIGNVTCNAVNPNGTDTWSFDVYVPGTSGSYDILGTGGGLGKSFNTTYTINAGNINPFGCEPYELKTKVDGVDCISNFINCPPKPCNDNSDCEDFEVTIDDIECEEENGDDFTITLDVTTTSTNYICYKEGSNIGSVPTSGVIGTFDKDVYITVYQCPNSDCSTSCTTPRCFKRIYIPKPDCSDPGFNSGSRSQYSPEENAIIEVMPNPASQNEVIIKSNLLDTKFLIYNQSGVLVHRGIIKNPTYIWETNTSAGLYIIKYHDSNGQVKTTKFIKL